MKLTAVTASVSRGAGGMFHSVRRLHQSLAALPGVSLQVLGLRDKFTSEDLPKWHPLSVRVFRVSGPMRFGYAPALKRALLESASDVVHSHGIWMYPAVATCSWHMATNRPFVAAAHGMLDPWALQQSRWKKVTAGWLYENAHLREAACLHALCESEARSMRAYGLKNPICLIPNGVDLPSGSDLWPPTSGRSPLRPLKEAGSKALLYLGRIHPKKGLVNLLKAWAGNQRTEGRGQKTEEWVLAIAGWDQGGHEVELKRLATDLGIRWADARQSQLAAGCSLLFLGPQFDEDKVGCYRDSDSFILPSLSEGLPMAVLEAWAFGKPVLMTPECNLPEGFAARAALRIESSTENIERGLTELLGMSDSERSQMGNRGRQLVAERFSWPGIAADLRAVYEWVLGGGPKPPSVLG